MTADDVEAAIARKVGSHKKPLIWLCALAATLILGAAIVVIVVGIEDHKRTNTVAKVTEIIVQDHNASACSFRVLVGGLRQRSLDSINDPSTAETARARAILGIPFYNGVIDGQITEPRDLDCKAFLAQLAREKKVPGVPAPKP